MGTNGAVPIGTPASLGLGSSPDLCFELRSTSSQPRLPCLAFRDPVSHCRIYGDVDDRLVQVHDQGELARFQ